MTSLSSVSSASAIVSNPSRMMVFSTITDIIQILLETSDRVNVQMEYVLQYANAELNRIRNRERHEFNNVTSLNDFFIMSRRYFDDLRVMLENVEIVESVRTGFTFKVDVENDCEGASYYLKSSNSRNLKARFSRSLFPIVSVQALDLALQPTLNVGLQGRRARLLQIYAD